MKTALATFLAVTATFAGEAALADIPALPDSGVYHVYVNDQALGYESFSFKVGRDSLFCSSHTVQTFPAADRTDTLDKYVQMIVGRLDQDLRWYQSNHRFRGLSRIRGLVMDDTLYTAYREDHRIGEGVRRVRPPGRLFVLEEQSFLVFDLVGRSYYDKTFTERPLQILVLSERDTVVEASIQDLGAETIRWGSRPIEARKLRIADANTEFITWMSPLGYMIRLEQPATGLRVERDAPPVKRRKL